MDKKKVVKMCLGLLLIVVLIFLVGVKLGAEYGWTNKTIAENKGMKLSVTDVDSSSPCTMSLPDGTIVNFEADGQKESVK